MTRRLRIAVADDEGDMRDFFRKILPHLGHDVVCVAENGRELVEQCCELEPDLIITDIEMPEMDGLDAIREISRRKPLPVIIVSAHHEPEIVDRATREYILAYLVKPIKKADLEPAILLAMERYAQFQALHEETDDLRQALEDRKTIERAKGILMKRGKLDEQDAFRRLQKISSEKNQKMVEIARMVIIAEEAFAS